ncbi:ScbA/BarX family gamma-butyrolactone biosynthesis protein [Kitasatospora sp. NPDC001261]|uniref:ScbA/BarX family gamma-butyrolactone biosynthesis protein n=1 Tax=Kitasatospora sp. NPDC001261 TaxID=3364012 RepID=UPI0036906389
MLLEQVRPVTATGPVLTTTVAREYVHRAAFSEVFLSGWRSTGQDTFVVTAQWPRSHSFYLSEHGLHDPLMLCETVRQTLLLLTHTAYGVPFGHQMSWSHFSYELSPGAPAMSITNAPAEIELHVTASEISYRRSVPVAMTMDFQVLRDGVPLATASTRFGTHAPALYQRLRTGRGDVERMFADAPAPTTPVTPSTVGRDRARDVVLTPTDQSGRWQLRVDTAHPVLFDHPVDHVPGMVLLEAARQALHSLEPGRSGTVPVSMDAVFHRYVEFDSPCWIKTTSNAPHSGEGRCVTVTAWQNERLAFFAKVATAPLT